MALDVSAINDEVQQVASGLSVPWSDFAIYCKAKIIECGINGGITSYSINGRTVSKDVAFWERALRFAMEMSSVDETGGIDQQPIRFVGRVR
jgi:hypothetical protein